GNRLPVFECFALDFERAIGEEPFVTFRQAPGKAVQCAPDAPLPLEPAGPTEHDVEIRGDGRAYFPDQEKEQECEQPYQGRQQALWNGFDRPLVQAIPEQAGDMKIAEHALSPTGFGGVWRTIVGGVMWLHRSGRSRGAALCRTSGNCSKHCGRMPTTAYFCFARNFFIGSAFYAPHARAHSHL